MYLTQDLQTLIEKYNKKLIFVHTPKCGGLYVKSVLSYLGIEWNKSHRAARQGEGITFTVIRDPVERFESLLNYRLGKPFIECDWPPHLRYVFKDTNVSLNEIVSKMSDSQLLGFRPYYTLTYWTTNVNIIITIDELPKLLELFGYTYDVNVLPKQNVSIKTRGKLNERSKNRINTLFKNDILLYNKVISTKNE